MHHEGPPVGLSFSQVPTVSAKDNESHQGSHSTASLHFNSVHVVPCVCTDTARPPFSFASRASQHALECSHLLSGFWSLSLPPAPHSALPAPPHLSLLSSQLPQSLCIFGFLIPVKASFTCFLCPALGLSLKIQILCHTPCLPSSTSHPCCPQSHLAHKQNCGRWLCTQMGQGKVPSRKPPRNNCMSSFHH